MLAKCLHFQGIENKQVEKFEQVNDMELYVLKGRTEPHHALYIKLDDEKHLFLACNISHINNLKDYDMSRINKHIIEHFNKSIENKYRTSLGIGQYLGRESEVLEVRKYQHEIAKKEAEQKEIERQRKEQEQRKIEMKYLQEQEEIFKQGEKIDGDDFVKLCDKYEIKLPLRTKGWAMDSLCSISYKSYSYCGNPSKVIMTYAEMLKDELLEDNEEEECQDVKGIFSFEGVFS